MFPIPFNFPFRKANGDISTIGAEINAGGGGSSYTLPTASASTKGGVKIGEGLTMDGEVLKNNNPTPATPYTLPTADANTLGGVKVGTGLSIDENGVLSASGGGGSSKYLHNIVLTDITRKLLISFKVVSTSSTPASTLNDVQSMLAVNFKGNDKYCVAGGSLFSGVFDATCVVYGVHVNSNESIVFDFVNPASGQTSESSGGTVTVVDTVEVL